MKFGDDNQMILFYFLWIAGSVALFYEALVNGGLIGLFFMVLAIMYLVAAILSFILWRKLKAFKKGIFK